jgi:methylmalonyl-CoA/ethylmalonyl-CoA epimerase
MAVVGLDHVGVVVADLEEAVARYRAVLGLRATAVETYGEGLLRIAFLPCGDQGPTAIELLQPLRPGSSAWEFLRRRGEGIEHVALAVDDLEEELTRLAASGAGMVDRCPRPGARNTRIAFLDPAAVPGLWAELVEGPGWAAAGRKAGDGR